MCWWQGKCSEPCSAPPTVQVCELLEALAKLCKHLCMTLCLPSSWEPRPPRSYSQEMAIISFELSHCLQLCLRACSSCMKSSCRAAQKMPQMTQDTDPPWTCFLFTSAVWTTKLTSHHQAFYMTRYSVPKKLAQKQINSSFCAVTHPEEIWLSPNN